MTATAAIPVSNSVVYQGPATPPAPTADDGLTFSALLSDLNPLQYLPVVGTIYRAITGDTIPKPLREAGSMLVSGLMGGPVGIATNLASVAFERLTGIDFEDLEQQVLGSLRPATADNASPPAGSAPPASGSPASAPPAFAPWTPTQLAAYGVVTSPDGRLHQGGLSEADILNNLQLAAIAGRY